MTRVFAKINHIFFITLCAAIVTLNQTARADTFTFSILPANGNISGPSGSRVGWGFSITNDSSSDWLVTTNLTADPFLHGTPMLLFNFPSIAPGQTAVESFNAAGGTGLYELSWDLLAPAGFVNRGNFVLSAQWWTGNPLSGGTLIADAPDASDPYSVSAGPSSTVPEPSSLLLILAVAALMAGRFLRRASP